jgi:hypothetical protein
VSVLLRAVPAGPLRRVTQTIVGHR